MCVCICGLPLNAHGAKTRISLDVTIDTFELLHSEQNARDALTHKGPTMEEYDVYNFRSGG